MGLTSRFQNAGGVLWNHKKKTAVFLAASAYGVNWMAKSARDSRIRRCYALEAKKFGDVCVSHPLERLRRVMVLLNRDANGGKANELFKKNALPLLHLAGLEVNIVEAKSGEEMQSLAEVIDTKEADCVYLVGGDGTLLRYLSGVFRKRESKEGGGDSRRSLPLGIFPGGKDNRSLVGLESGVFKGNKFLNTFVAIDTLLPSRNQQTTGGRNDVRSYCESAMALIEHCVRNISPMRCEIRASGEDPQTLYALGDVRVGWFEHCEQRKRKLWYWGALKEYVCYFLEFSKRKPLPMHIHLDYEEFCDGCNKCREQVKPKPAQKWSWLNMFVSRSPKSDTNRRVEIDYSGVENERCGLLHTVDDLRATDVEIQAMQSANGSKLSFKAGGSSLGRMESMYEGWRRCANKIGVGSLFYDSVVEARSLLIKFNELPNPIQKISISGELHKLAKPGEVVVEVTTVNRQIPIFLPRSKRAFDFENR